MLLYNLPHFSPKYWLNVKHTFSQGFSQRMMWVAAMAAAKSIVIHFLTDIYFAVQPWTESVSRINNVVHKYCRCVCVKQYCNIVLCFYFLFLFFQQRHKKIIQFVRYRICTDLHEDSWAAHRLAALLSPHTWWLRTTVNSTLNDRMLWK